MNGPHDLGGAMGFGRVIAEANEPTFHEPWEARVLAFNLAAGALGEWNVDESRSARESLHPVTYLSSSYYEIWLRGLTKLLEARGLVTCDEIERGRPMSEPRSTRRTKMAAADVAERLAKGSPSTRPAPRPQRYAVGQRVRARNEHPFGHTRLPRYARGRVGVIEAVHGAHSYPDSQALGSGDDPQWLYTVAFEGQELWGAGSDPCVVVSVDAFEPYLEAIDR